jgi:formylglycine-generating enzyme required for sulfatase activity
MAWHRENSDNRTHPVATKRPNAIGFYDMHGNVAEWCLNDRGRSGLQTSILSTSGGSWRDAPNHLLSGGQVSDQGFSHIGFRIIAVRSNVLDREKQKEGTSDE